jgi:hypothetical protein
MSQYTDYIRWESRCRVHAGYGMTAGDSQHLGLHNYTEPYPCPNGLPIDYRDPGQTEWWRKRIEKAKRDIELHGRRVAAAEIEWDANEILELYREAMEY